MTLLILFCCAEYSKTLMREAKAHFEEATLATPPSQSGTSFSGETQPTDGQASPIPDTASPSGSSQSTNGTEQTSTRTAANGSSALQQPSASNSKAPSTIATNDTHALQSSQSSASSVASCSPQSALAAAHKATKQPGSSTALVLQIREGSNTLKASNLVRAILSKSCYLLLQTMHDMSPFCLLNGFTQSSAAGTHCHQGQHSLHYFKVAVSKAASHAAVHPALRPHQLWALSSYHPS